MKIHRATATDIATVAEMWMEAASWLNEYGTDQWQYPVKMHNIRAAVAEQSCWLIEEFDSVVGTVTLDAKADLSLWWKAEDEPDSALYLHRLVVRRSVKGRNLGSAIVDWASRRAASLQKSWLRLDAWTSNPSLHRYYQRLGFDLVRTEIGPDVVSGVLFQRPAGVALGRGPLLTECPTK